MTRLIAFLTTLLFSSGVAAQTVNIESMTQDKPGFGLSLVGGLNLARGHVSQTKVNGSLHGQYQLMHDDPDPEDDVPAFLQHRWLVTGSGGYAITDGTVTANKRFTHLRWTAMWLRRLGHETFAQYQFSEFARLQARILGGTGARVVLLHHKRIGSWLGTGYMLEFEQLTAAAEGDPKPDSTLAHRWSNFLALRLALTDIVALTNTVYLQPRFDDFSDYRLLDQASLAIQITKHIALGTTFEVARDSEPPAGVSQTNVEFAQTIKFTF
jgi:hypothetical protein